MTLIRACGYDTHLGMTHIRACGYDRHFVTKTGPTFFVLHLGAFYCNDTPLHLQRTHAGRTAIREDYQSEWAKLSEDVKQQIGHQITDMLLDCSYDGEQCDEWSVFVKKSIRTSSHNFL